LIGERPTAQEGLFYKFSLDRHVPADHLFELLPVWWTPC
jgi:hypothetical protein